MSRETERVSVCTYVPAYQREMWRSDADRLGMSQSEYVRSMVQAGRRGFDTDDESVDIEEGDPSGTNPRGNGLETTILQLLEESGPLQWEELVSAVEDAIDSLQADSRIHHSGRQGGYVPVESTDGE